MEQQEKIEKLKEFLDSRNVKYIQASSNYQGNSSWVLYLKYYNIPVYDDTTVNTDKAYFISTEHHVRPFFIRQSETIEFILQKMNNMLDEYERKREVAKERKIKKKYNRCVMDFLKKGVWQKLDTRHRRSCYHSKPSEFYDKFTKRQYEQYDGDFDKTAESFVDEYSPEFRPKPKRKRMHFVPVKPIRHN